MSYPITPEEAAALGCISWQEEQPVDKAAFAIGHLALQPPLDPSNYHRSFSGSLRAGAETTGIWLGSAIAQLLAPSFLTGAALGIMYGLGYGLLCAFPTLFAIGASGLAGFFLSNPIGIAIVATTAGLIFAGWAICQIVKKCKASNRSQELQQAIYQAVLFNLRDVAAPQGMDQALDAHPEFKTKLRQLQTLISSEGSIQEIRKTLHELLCSGVYQTHKNIADSPISIYLQDLSVALTEVNVGTMFAKHAEVSKIGRIQECSDLANAFQKELQSSTYYKRDNLLQKIEWAFWHPKAVYHSRTASRFGAAYDSHHGNSDYLNGNSSPIRFIWGPCPTGDAIFEQGILPAYQRLGQKRLLFNYQDLHIGGKKKEIERSNELIRMANEHPQNLFVVAMDYHALNSDAALKHCENSENFLNGFKQKLQGCRNSTENNSFGYYIPESALSNSNFEQAFQAAHKFRVLLEAKPFFQTLSPKEKNNVLKLMTDAILTLAIYKEVHPHTVSGACKEDIDRGPPENMLMMLFDAFGLEDGGTKMLKEQGSKLVAAAFARARHTPQERNPQTSKVTPLIQLLSCIDNETMRKEMGKALKEMQII